MNHAEKPVSDFRVVVGLRLDRPGTEYYLGFDSRSARGSKFDSVRAMLEEHLDELQRQSAALRMLLSTKDPEEAESFLQDGVRLQVSEVILRPALETEALRERLAAGIALDPGR
jgi:hypothetical protein